MNMQLGYYLYAPLRRIVRNGFYTYCSHIPDKLFIQLSYLASMYRWPNLNKPKKFTEKLQWLKLYGHQSFYTTLADKLSVKQRIEDLIGSDHTVKTLGVWNDPAHIDFSLLPEQFVLKCSHDSGSVIVCRDKNQFDTASAIDKLQSALRKNYFLESREKQYQNIPRKVFAEEYLSQDTFADYRGGGKGLVDYKFFVFFGEIKFLYISEGLENHSTATMTFMDVDGNVLPFGRYDYRSNPRVERIPEPVIDVARKLAKVVIVPHVRIDLYYVNGITKFSEFTFFTCGGLIPLSPRKWDAILGDYIEMDRVKKYIIERQEIDNSV